MNICIDVQIYVHVSVYTIVAVTIETKQISMKSLFFLHLHWRAHLKNDIIKLWNNVHSAATASPSPPSPSLTSPLS